MLIESKFKDYYDSGLVYGIDNKIYFKRKQKKIKIDVSFPGGIYDFKNKGDYYSLKIYSYIIGFCGDFFPLTSIKFINKKGNIIEEDFCYTLENFILFFKGNNFTINILKRKKWYKDIGDIVFDNTNLNIKISDYKSFRKRSNNSNKNKCCGKKNELI